MYRRLEAELILAGILKKELAERIKMPYSTLVDKINNRTSFTLDELTTEQIYSCLSNLFGAPCDADVDVDCVGLIECDIVQSKEAFGECWRIALEAATCTQK